MGREWALRRNRAEAAEGIRKARQTGDAQEAPMFFGQDAGLIDDVPPAADIVERIVAEAEEIITKRLSGVAGR